MLNEVKHPASCAEILRFAQNDDCRLIEVTLYEYVFT